MSSAGHLLGLLRVDALRVVAEPHRRDQRADAALGLQWMGLNGSLGEGATVGTC